MAAISTLVTQLHDLLIEDWTDFFLNKCTSNTSDECPESEPSSDSHQQHTDASQNALLVREVLQRLGQSLGKIPSIPEAGEATTNTQLMQQQCDQLTAYVSDQLDQMEALEDGMLLAERPSVAIEMNEKTNEHSRNVWLQMAISNVDARLDGYEGQFHTIIVQCSALDTLSMFTIYIKCLHLT